MSEELKQAAQRLDDDVRSLSKWLNEEITAPIDRAALARVLHALTQRPAAQTEREAFESRVTLNSIIKQYRIKAEDAHWLRASLPAPQQATPEPVQFDQAGHFYNLVGHALMDVERPDACEHRLRFILDELAALLRQPATPEPVGERWVVVRETTLDVGRGNDVRTGGRPELGYALVSNAATFGSEDEAVAAIKSASLPVGWVVLPLSRLLPDLMATRPAPGVPDGLDDQIMEALRDGLSVCMSVAVSRDRKIRRDGCTLYAQSEEWCRWLDAEVGPKIRAALDALAAQAKGGQ